VPCMLPRPRSPVGRDGSQPRPPRRPFLPTPPPPKSRQDPFVLERGDPATGREWTLLLASGLKGRGGAVLVFKSPRLLDSGPVFLFGRSQLKNQRSYCFW
jgi:hypothetical protein